MELQVTIRRDEGHGALHTTMRCWGDLDVSTAAKLIDAFDQVARERPDEVLVDLRGIGFMDATGLGCLTHAVLAFRDRTDGFHILASTAVDLVVAHAGLATLLKRPAPVRRPS